MSAHDPLAPAGPATAEGRAEAARRVGTDTGGTFTDLVAADGSIVKVPSTPDDPGRAVRAGLAALLGDQRAAVLAHGTTVATNALLERTGAAVALVTNEGFADVIEIARQDRPSLYDHTVDRPTPLVDRAHRVEVRGRIGPDGTELEPLDISSLPPLPEGTEVAAVCLLHADLNPSHERLVGIALEERGADVTLSSAVSPEFREYERTVTTVVNAYLRPACSAYLAALAGAADAVVVMTSAGGLVPLEEAAAWPATLLLSGPAGGVLAASAVAAANGFPDAVTFDMGGTSTDVCLVLGGQPEPAAERVVAGLPVRLPSLDVHTIGAGGGSIARIDPGGALLVGPQSAGAVPGPACYGHGGTEPTVTDADLVLGRLPTDHELPGIGRLDLDAAARALAAAGVDAAGVVAVADAAMEQAIRRVSVERGVDPRGLALVAFGGAGPLHACALAEALDMAAVIVPARAGVLSAVGILTAPLRHDVVESWPTPADHEGLDTRLQRLALRAGEELAAWLGDHSGWLTWKASTGRFVSGEGVTGTVTVALDCRYAGQSHELRVPSVAAFHAEHERRNGYSSPDAPVEVVALRAGAVVEAPLSLADLPAPERSGAVGPAVVAEPDCTIWIPGGWTATPGAAGALVLRRTPPG